MAVTRFLLILILTWASALLAEAQPRYSEITATPLSDLPSWKWQERQLLQADKEGRVFLLREDTLDLYQISSSGKLVPKGRLLEHESSAKRLPVFGAAMSPSGDAWVLFSAPNHLYLFREGRMESLEAAWEVSAVATDGGEPLVALAPGEMNTTAPTLLRLERPPLLQKWDGKRWNTLAEGRFPGDPPEGVTFGEHWRGEFSLVLALTPERCLWVADRYAYRLRHFRPSGALDDELSVQGGKVTWSERTEKEWADAEAAAKAGGLAWSRRRLSPVRAEEVVRAITVGHDGAVYLLVRTGKGLALDRFHPTLLTLDRLMLQGIDVPGRLMMAAGTPGIYIAAWSGFNGIWLIDFETLDKADWRPVPDAMLNGQPLVPLQERAEDGTKPAPAKLTPPGLVEKKGPGDRQAVPGGWRGKV